MMDTYQQCSLKIKGDIMENFKPEIAFIMRSDKMIEKFNLKRVTINTSFGPVHRCYEGYIYDVPVLIIYGRFNGEKVPSSQINFQQTIEAVKNRGVDKLIGTFVVGGINPEMPQGSVYILGNFVGMGNYNTVWNQSNPFHNAEMYEPFCPKLTQQLIKASKKMPFKVKPNATYVSFSGYPRIETKAELEYYNRQGWDIVGQTCDAEATYARLSNICYAGVAVQIDDPNSRAEYINDLSNKKEAKAYVETIKSCRERTTQIILQFLKNYKSENCTLCQKLSRKNKDFRQFPDYFYE